MSQNGLPPGSGGVALRKCPDMFCEARSCDHFQHHTEEEVDLDYEYSCDEVIHMPEGMPPCGPCSVVGVRFPADDPDPGRWYRKEREND